MLLAVVKQDKALLRFLLQCSRDQLMREDSGEQKAAPGFRTIDFHHALENGYMEIIAEMVKMAGAELPLKALVKEAGIEEIEKPKVSKVDYIYSSSGCFRHIFMSSC